MTTPVPLAGSILRGSVLAALLDEARPVSAFKPANETVTNSTTLQADDHLLWPVRANAVYTLWMVIYFNSGATPDLKLRFTGPSGYTITWSTIALNASAVTNLAGPLTEATTAVYDGQGANAPIYIDGRVVVGATAGTLGIEWAQNTANASATTVLAGSFGLLFRVG